MFSKSSQLKYWTFTEEELQKNRFHANRKYITERSTKEVDETCYLTPEEELLFVQHYEYIIKSFYLNFKPRKEPLPNDVKGTAFHFFKRFYLVSSVMDFHPKEMMLTCIYLACKICEYYIPLEVFVRNIDGDSRLLKFIIVDQEMELLYRLNFRLNIHTPHRAIEGCIIDLKTRSKLHDPERVHEHISRFLCNMWHTDVCLMYSPALIALATVMHAVTRCKENIDDYVMQTLLDKPSEATSQGVISTVRKIRSTVINMKGSPTAEMVCQIEKKLSNCRNPRNDPTSSKFKQKMLEFSLETSG